MCDKIVWAKGEIAVINQSGAIPKGAQVTIQESICQHKIVSGDRVRGSYKGETFQITSNHLDKL